MKLPIFGTPPVTGGDSCSWLGSARGYNFSMIAALPSQIGKGDAVPVSPCRFLKL